MDEILQTLQTLVSGRYALNIAKQIVEGTDHLMTLEEFNRRKEE